VPFRKRYPYDKLEMLETTPFVSGVTPTSSEKKPALALTHNSIFKKSPRKKGKERHARQGEGGASESSGGAGGSNTTRAERKMEFGVTTARGAEKLRTLLKIGSSKG